MAERDKDCAATADAIEEWGDWASTRRRKLILGMAASPAQRLQWLEDALVLAEASGALARLRRARAAARR